MLGLFGGKEGVFSNHLEIQSFLCPSVGFAHRARGPVKQAVQAHWADTSKAVVHQKMDPCFLTSTRGVNNLRAPPIHLSRSPYQSQSRAVLTHNSFVAREH